MALEHLTDEQLQDYLDQNPVADLAGLEAHLEQCPNCRRQLEQYRAMSRALAEDTDFDLPSDFAANVIGTLQEVGAERILHKLAQIILWAAGALTGIAILIRFTDFEQAFVSFSPLGTQSKNALTAIVTSFKTVFAGSDLNLGIISVIISVLLAIYLIDRLIIRARKQITSTNCLI